MNAVLRNALVAAGLVASTHAAAQVVFYEHDGFQGRSFTAENSVQDFQRFGAPDVLSHSMLFSAVSTYGTLAVELMLAILIWNRAARPLVLALGVGLHMGIDMTLRIGFFSAAVSLGSCEASSIPIGIVAPSKSDPRPT